MDPHGIQQLHADATPLLRQTHFELSSMQEIFLDLSPSPRGWRACFGGGWRAGAPAGNPSRTGRTRGSARRCETSCAASGRSRSRRVSRTDHT